MVKRFKRMNSISHGRSHIVSVIGVTHFVLTLLCNMHRLRIVQTRLVVVRPHVELL